MKTKVAEQFLKLIDKHFNAKSKLNKIFNRNTVKVSYSCMNSMAQIVKAHNAKVTNNTVVADKPCNCQKKQNCPLNGRCQVTNIVYLANIVGNNDSKFYIGGSEHFKERFANHTKSFKHKQYEKETELSKYVWELKDSNHTYEIKWSILRKTTGYNNISQTCNLCASEKLAICLFKDKNKLINKRNELVSKCRHENKYLLRNFRYPNG